MILYLNIQMITNYCVIYSPKPYMDGMMTKKWLKTDEDFNEVVTRIENYTWLCKSMRAPSAQVSLLASAQRCSLITAPESHFKHSVYIYRFS